MYPNGSGGYIQHVAYVEQVHSVNTSTIDYTISQQSWGLPGEINNCNDQTRNGSSYRISAQLRSEVEFIHRQNGPAPTGTIATPAQNATVSGVVRISGQATASNATINVIQIFINDALRSQVSVAGSNWFWDWATTSEEKGTYRIRVKAFDSSGQSAWLKTPSGSDPLTIQLDNPAQIIPQASNCLKPLLRYWSQSRQKHFYTANPAEYGSPGRDGWVYEGYIGFVAKDAICHMPNAIPLYRFWSESSNKHFYTTNHAEGVAAGYADHGVEGYVSPSANSQYHTKPIKRFYRAAIYNHYYTDNMTEAPGDYNDEGIKFYAFNLVNKAPNKPTLAAPAHNSTTVNKTLALSWADAGDADSYPRNFRDYEVTIRKVGGTWTQTRTWSSPTAWNVTVPETGQYCWKVQSGDGEAMSGWTAERCLTIYPAIRMVTDYPVGNASLTQGLTYRLNGWSIQQETPSGTGIDKIHVYLDGPAGSGQLLGTASYGQERSDIARIYGDRFKFSGFSYSWNTKNASVGTHTLYIYSNSTVTGWSSMTRTVNIVAAKKIFVPLVRK